MELTNGAVPASLVSVFLLVQNRVLREALVRLFRKRADLNVVGESSPTAATPEGLRASACSVLVLDSFPFPECLVTLSHSANTSATAPKTVLIGMEPDENKFLAAVRSGAIGYLLKDASAADVVTAVRSAYRGEAVCSPSLCSMLFRAVAQAGTETLVEAESARPDLTLRQQQLVSLIAKGFTNKEIASHLNLSEFTVRNHIHRILKQVDAESRSEAVENIRSFGYAISG